MHDVERKAHKDSLLDVQSIVPTPLDGWERLQCNIRGWKRIGNSHFKFVASPNFNNFIANAFLFDIGYSKIKFTWCNKKEGPARQWARLDICLFNEALIDFFSLFQCYKSARHWSSRGRLPSV